MKVTFFIDAEGRDDLCDRLQAALMTTGRPVRAGTYGVTLELNPGSNSAEWEKGLKAGVAKERRRAKFAAMGPRQKAAFLKREQEESNAE